MNIDKTEIDIDVSEMGNDTSEMKFDKTEIGNDVWGFELIWGLMGLFGGFVVGTDDFSGW